MYHKSSHLWSVISKLILCFLIHFRLSVITYLFLSLFVYSDSLSLFPPLAQYYSITIFCRASPFPSLFFLSLQYHSRSIYDSLLEISLPFPLPFSFPPLSLSCKLCVCGSWHSHILSYVFCLSFSYFSSSVLSIRDFLYLSSQSSTRSCFVPLSLSSSLMHLLPLNRV